MAGVPQQAPVLDDVVKLFDFKLEKLKNAEAVVKVRARACTHARTHARMEQELAEEISVTLSKKASVVMKMRDRLEETGARHDARAYDGGARRCAVRDATGWESRAAIPWRDTRIGLVPGRSARGHAACESCAVRYTVLCRHAMAWM